MSCPLGRDVLKVMAEHAGACVRPLAIRRVDTETGATDILEVPCGARLAVKCKPCAERNRRLRIAQFNEGWHLADEPAVKVKPADAEVVALVSARAHMEYERHALNYEPMSPQQRQAQRFDLDRAIDQLDDALAGARVRGRVSPVDRTPKPRRTRSTRRRQDAPDLPKLPVDNRTVGRAFTGRDGTVHRPSTLLTVTLPSHGLVHTAARYRRGGMKPCDCGALHGERDPLLGTPIDGHGYDYRRAALDAIHFAAVLDRFWQNLRRCAGWKVQYAGAVELQKRLAPHAHYCMRGTLPRALVRQAAAATYHQVWWPRFDRPVYTSAKPPRWDNDRDCWTDPTTGAPLRTWDQASAEDTTGGDPQPAHLAVLGRVDVRGINPGSKDAHRAVRYVTKYVTKDLTEQAAPGSPEQETHFDRLHAELQTLPCSERCANWLLYGIQPMHATERLRAGACTGKVHQKATLGFTGRRVLISRQWSGKTLTDHRNDRRDWVRTIVAGALSDEDQAAADAQAAAEPGRFRFELAKPGDPDLDPPEIRLQRAISERTRWKAQLTALRAVPATPADLATAA